MLKKLLLVPSLITLFALSAQAGTVLEFQGRVAKKEQCMDDGKGAFAKHLGCKAIPSESSQCVVTLKANSEGINKIEIKLTGGAKKAFGTGFFEGRVKGPYLYKDNFVAYYVKLDKDTSAEVKIQSNGSGKVLAANLYNEHVFRSDGNRLFKQFTCVDFKKTK